jgi:3-oxoacyl-[acyl-carrier-protein] synthase III
MAFVPVRVAGTGSFLPGPPVSNDRVEMALGTLDRAAPRIKNFVENQGPKFLEQSGIALRHFAVDPQTGELTHTHSSLAENAARQALEMAGMKPQDMELIVVACPTYDHATPPTSTLVQERLNIPNCAEMEIHSNCAGVGKSVQIAFDALRSGRYRTALVTYSQLSSMYLRGCFLNQEKMDRVHVAMRWILADGAGALVLEARPENHVEHEILGTFTESVGPGRQPGMTAGGYAADLAKTTIPQMYDQAKYHLWQDFAATNRDAGPLLLDGLCKFTRQLGINSDTVDHYVLSIPTVQFYNSQFDAFIARLGITREQGRFRGANTGYCGGASILLHFDEMVRSGELKSGQTAVVHSVESSKWMSAGFAVRW